MKKEIRSMDELIGLDITQFDEISLFDIRDYTFNVEHNITIRLHNSCPRILLAGGSSLVVVAGGSSPVIEATGESSPRVEAYDTSTPLVEAHDVSRPRVETYETSAPQVRAYDMSLPQVRAYGSSRPRVVAYDVSRPRIVARGASTPRVLANEASSPRIEAYDASTPQVIASDKSAPQVKACGTSAPQIRALGSSNPRVEAFEASRPRVEAFEASSPQIVSVDRSTPQVKACERSTTQVRAYEGSTPTVIMYDNSIVRYYGPTIELACYANSLFITANNEFVPSAHVIIQPNENFNIFDRYGLEKAEEYILYKKVSREFKTREGTPNETSWNVGTTVRVEEWDPTLSECGDGKFHAVIRPFFADRFRWEPGDRYIAILIQADDLYEWDDPFYPYKIAFKEGKVLYECDPNGIEIVSD